MDYKTKANLISALADNFSTAGADDLRISTSNYISNTGAMNCTALGLSMEDLEKTKNVIELHEQKFSKYPNDNEASQYLLHLRVAKKCVEEIIAQKQQK